MTKVRTIEVSDVSSRRQALHVIEEVYLKEKRWILGVENEIPPCQGGNDRYSWFLATVDEEPAGVLRLFYDPPLELPEEYAVSLLEDVDLVRMGRVGRFVEIGRFMIIPRYRRKILVALRLMEAAVRQVVERDYTHFITDVFEGEPHSPLRFHTSILGFEIIGRHLHGELNCSLTRIILTLDILKAYQRLKERKNRVYRSLTEGIRGILEEKLTRSVQGQP